MPRRNRVSSGRIHPRGRRARDILGNRGVLHDADGEIRRRWQGKRWPVCGMGFLGRHRVVMAPNRYTELWVLGRTSARRASALDRWKRTFTADLDVLPDGIFVVHEGHPHMVLGDALLTWSFGGYTARTPRPPGRVVVLTPPSTVAAIASGYRPVLHASATETIALSVTNESPGASDAGQSTPGESE